MTHEDTITRREAVKAAGSAGAVLLSAPVLAAALGPVTALAAAKATPELTEGPYWVNTLLHRSNVLANAQGGGHQAGVPLDLYINVFDLSNGGKRLSGVAVDIWHANAHGLYSDEKSQQAGGGTNSASGDTIKDNWLRGYQITGKDKGLNHNRISGQVSFRTIWPGWYTSRAIHIHVRVRRLHTSGATIAGYTTQIFFSDADNSRVLTGAAPYDTRSPQTDPTTDENDTVLTGSDTATNVVKVRGSIRNGFATTFNIALTTAEVSAKGSLGRPNAGGGGSGPGGPPPS
jgi:protocatechuate 3,4-dioxygenase beta subunit